MGGSANRKLGGSVRVQTGTLLKLTLLFNYWKIIKGDRLLSYVDGFLAAVPKANKEKFIEHAKISAEVMKDCGALSVVDCWEDDVPGGQLTSMPMAVQKKDHGILRIVYPCQCN